MSAELGVILLLIGLPLLPIAAFSTALKFFIALKEPPSRRAAWTVGIAYVSTAILLNYWFSDFPDIPIWVASVAPIPSALAAFWFWRDDFRRRWIDNDTELTEDHALADDDWRSGLLRLFLAILALTAWGLFRYFRSNIGT